jgi:hypothetical protein
MKMNFEWIKNMSIKDSNLKLSDKTIGGVFMDLRMRRTC